MRISRTKAWNQSVTIADFGVQLGHTQAVSFEFGPISINRHISEDLPAVPSEAIRTRKSLLDSLCLVDPPTQHPGHLRPVRSGHGGASAEPKT